MIRWIMAAAFYGSLVYVCLRLTLERHYGIVIAAAIVSAVFTAVIIHHATRKTEGS
jgi:hypothetical protein